VTIKTVLEDQIRRHTSAAPLRLMLSVVVRSSEGWNGVGERGEWMGGKVLDFARSHLVSGVEGTGDDREAMEGEAMEC
jgi:hypothetical protein